MTDSTKTVEELRPMLLRMLNSRVMNYATPGLTSALVGGVDREGLRFGNVRYFCADRSTRHEITPHSHRFAFTCLVIRGTVTNTLFERGHGDEYVASTLRPKDGGMGGYELVRGTEPMNFREVSTVYAPGETYSMSHHQIHSIRFSRGAEVLFFEGPQQAETSVILEPWSNGGLVETFEVRPWMFQHEPDVPF